MQENIEATIGTEHELIVIDNSENRYSIFEAYNIGVSKSKYPYLCFMHDDIAYHSNNWGLKVIEHFADISTGAIGVAGTPYYPQMPGSWWGGGLVNQSLVTTNNSRNETMAASVNGNSSLKNQVVVLDGIWICIRRGLFKEVSFDERTYTGFHFYDMDICMQIHQLGYNLYCVYDVLLTHFSKGAMNRNWCENALIFQNKWKHMLPACCSKLAYFVRCNAELKTLREYTYVMASNSYTSKSIGKFALQQIVKCYKAWFYYKTPVHLFYYFLKFIGK